MIALLPVSRYRVTYHTASGRPYSFFDRLVLEAIGSGTQSSLDLLEDQFRIHRRVIIESLLTLMHAGWVAIDTQSHSLVETAAGRAALTNAMELPPNISVVERRDTLVGERATGQLAKGSEITFASKNDLKDLILDAVVIPKGDVPHPLEAGLVVPFLRKAEGEWVRSCGQIAIIRDGADYVVVDVNTSTSRITGLPARWLPALQDELIARARQQENALALSGGLRVNRALEALVRREDTGTSEASTDEWGMGIRADTFVVGVKSHAQCLAAWLNGALSYLCIVTSVIDAQTVDDLLPMFKGAMERGTRIDIVIGSMNDGEVRDGGMKGLRKLEWDSRHAPSGGKLSISQAPSGSHANILIGDPNGTYQAMIGSHVWLANRQSTGADAALSVALSDPTPVARLARLVADLQSTDARLATGAGVTFLRNASAHLERLIAESKQRSDAEARILKEVAIDVARMTLAEQPPQMPNIAPDSANGALRGRLLVGREHFTVLPTLARQAITRLTVSSGQWGDDASVAIRPVIEALARGCEGVEITYSYESGAEDARTDAKAEIEKMGGSVRQDNATRANYIVVNDDILVVSSFEWLCPVIERSHGTLSDIGIVLRGSGVGRQFAKALAASELLEAAYVTAVRIDGVRSIQHLSWEIPLDRAPGWHVIIGDNGAGKTTMLRAIAVGLMGPEVAQGLRQDWRTWIRGTSVRASAAVTFAQQSTDQRTLPRRVQALEWNRGDAQATLGGELAERPVTVAMSYGPFRRFGVGEQQERQAVAVPALMRHLSLFDENVGLAESLAWLKDLRFKSLEGDLGATGLLQRLIELTNNSGMLPRGVGVSEIRSDAVIFADEGGTTYDVDLLSDGYRSVLSLTFDIIRQLCVAYGSSDIFYVDTPCVVRAAAVVLIDEVDAHLHPAWQRTIGQWFRAHFPRVQFVVTTHSPLVCQAAEVGTVFRLPNSSDPEDGGEMLNGVSLDRILYGNLIEAYSSGAFGETVTRSDSAKAMLERLAFLNVTELRTGLSAPERDEQDALRRIFPLAPQRPMQDRA